MGVGFTLFSRTSAAATSSQTFYATLAVATLVGVAFNFTSFNPMQALIWSAVINGVVAGPVMVLMMFAANPKVMGQFTVTGVLRFTAWLATAVMAAAVAGMQPRPCS